MKLKRPVIDFIQFFFFGLATILSLIFLLPGILIFNDLYILICGILTTLTLTCITVARLFKPLSHTEPKFAIWWENLKKILQKFKNFIKQIWNNFMPTKWSWQSAILGLFVWNTIMYCTVYTGSISFGGFIDFFYAIYFMVILSTAFALVTLVFSLVMKCMDVCRGEAPWMYPHFFLGLCFSLLYIFGVSSQRLDLIIHLPYFYFMYVITIPIGSMALIIGIKELVLIIKKRGENIEEAQPMIQETPKRKSPFKLVLCVFVLLVMIVANAALGTAIMLRPPYDYSTNVGMLVGHLNATDPSLHGQYAVEHLVYGSGTDYQRPNEYGDSVPENLRTTTVDMSSYIQFNTWRRWYWRFNEKNIPLNAHAWFPKGNGSFPVVIIVHGQHQMHDYAETKYKYLGELLASRGMITISIDENFLGYYLGLEYHFGSNPVVRALLILHHLNVWRNWTNTPNHPLYNKADLNNVALIGHGHGGQAVVIAHAFNKLVRNPDNPNSEPFDFNFGIKGIVTLAPTEATYSPSQKTIHLQNVNYLQLYGGMDGEVTHAAMSQYHQCKFSKDSNNFKAFIYVNSANHGQWVYDTKWGRYDTPFRIALPVWSLRNIMSMDDQLQVAKVFISAFLNETFTDSGMYRPIFQDFRAAQSWLPNTTFYINQYEDSSFKVVANFEEDIDVTTTTIPGGNISVSEVSEWYETDMKVMESLYKTTFAKSTAVYLGIQALDKQAAYTIHLPSIAHLNLTSDSHLQFHLSEEPNSRVTHTIDNPRCNIFVQVKPCEGSNVRVRLNRLPPMEYMYKKKVSLELPNLVLQLYSIPLREFLGDVGQVKCLKLIEFHFESGNGLFVIDNIGFM